MADEVELKLALAEADHPRLLRQPLLRQAVRRHVETLDNIYYDTPDLALRRRRIALRLRRTGREWRQTVKLAGHAAGGLSRRPEWETPYGGRFDFSSVDDPAVRQWLEKPQRLARIVPICETRFKRIAWTFAAPGGEIVLTLDRGWVIANGRREAISELELELAGASTRDLFALAAQLAERVTLVPAVLSKAERGYRLHLGVAPAPTRAAPVPLDAALAPHEAFRRIALSCLEQLQANHPGALASDDPEYIHQMRVAARRLRAAVRLFAPVLPAGAGQALRAPLAGLMTQLGHARDLDVLLTEITDPVQAALPGEPRLPALASDITNRRYAARADAIALLASRGYGQTALAALEMLHGAHDGGMPWPGSLLDFAAARVARLHRRMRRLAQAARIDDPASLHALRIGVKRLRYALEFFSPLVAGKMQKKTLKELAALQDTLGQLNDLANAGALLMACAGDDPRLREAVTLVGGWHGPRYANLLDRVKLELVRLPRLRPPAIRGATRRSVGSPRTGGA